VNDVIRLRIARWFSAERIVLALVVFVGLWLTQGRGWTGIVLFIGCGAIVGLVLGLIGRRYPMVYAQNRRDRRRDSN
jgi:hypothetical protein